MAESLGRPGRHMTKQDRPDITALKRSIPNGWQRETSVIKRDYQLGIKIE